MPEGEIRPPQNFVERTIPKSAERIPRLEVTKAALEIAQFYRLPEEVAKKGVNSEVYFLSQKELAVIALSEFNRTTGRNLTSEEYLQLRGEKIKQAQSQSDGLTMMPKIDNPSLEEVLAMGGICLPWDSEKSLIYLNKQSTASPKRILRHELFHGMSSNGPGIGFGFVSVDRKGNELEEASVEFLEIFQRAPELAKGNLSNLQYVKGGEGDTESPYYMEMNTLGFLLECAEGNNKPVTALDIANIRFNPSKGPEQRRQALKAMLLERIGPEGLEIPIEIFDNLAA